MGLPQSNVRKIFTAVLDLETKEARRAYLADVAERSPEIARAVNDLLQAHEAAGGRAFLSANPRWFQDSKPADGSALATENLVGSRVGPYRLLEQIGEGGMGTVYMAEQMEPVRRRVALKIIKLGMDTRQVVARFESERQALAIMDHPNIAKVLDAGATDKGRPYFVMELIRGTPITRFCDENRLLIKERLELFLTVCRAIQHAHQKGVIHRDIKPSNILVTLNGGVPHPMVIDFGVAKAIDQSLTDRTLFTRFAQMVGTPSFMSPEQTEMSIQDVDTRTDIYSLGILLYELLTGTTPFPEERLKSVGVAEIQRLIKEEEPVRPSTLMSRLDGQRRAAFINRGAEPAALIRTFKGDLDWIVLKAIEKDRNRRYETANGLAMDIVRHLKDEPVTAAAPTWSYRLGKLYRRNRAALHALVVVILLLTLTAMVSTVLAIRANVAEKKAAGALAQEAEMRNQAETAVEVARRWAYAADMNLAQGALDEDILGRARILLDRHRPSPGQTDIRGWEWRYLWQQSRSDERETLFNTEAYLDELDISSDGRWLATADDALGGTGKVFVWDLPGRRKVAELNHRGVVDLAVSPVEPVLAFTDEAGSPQPGKTHRIRLWNMETRRHLRDLPLPGPSQELHFSADGQRLLSATEDSIILWDLATGKKSRDYKTPVKNWGGNRAAVSPDFGVAYFIGEHSGRIREIDLSNGQETQWATVASNDTLIALALSPDGMTLATGDGFSASTIGLWDTRTRREIGRLEGHRTLVFSLVFGPDGKTLASASGDQTIRLWDLQKMELVRVLRGHAQEVWDIVWSRDGRTLISAGKDGSVKLWDTAEANRASGLVRLRTGLRSPYERTDWAFGPDSASVHVLNRKTGEVDRWSGTAFADRKTVFRSDPLKGTSWLSWAGAWSQVFSENGERLAIGSEGGPIEIWDVTKGLLVTELSHSYDTVIPLRFTRENSLWVGVAGRTELQEWDLGSGSMRRALPVPELMPFAKTTNLRTMSDRHFFSVKPGGEGQLVDLETGGISFPISPGKVFACGFSPDGETLAITHGPGVLAMARTGSFAREREPAAIRLEGILGALFSIAFTPDGKRVAASSSNNEAIRIWDMSGYQELLTLSGPGLRFSGAAYSPDGNTLGAMSTDGTLHLWRAPSWEVIAEAGDRTSP